MINLSHMFKKADAVTLRFPASAAKPATAGFSLVPSLASSATTSPVTPVKPAAPPAGPDSMFPAFKPTLPAPYQTEPAAPGVGVNASTTPGINPAGGVQVRNPASTNISFQTPQLNSDDVRNMDADSYGRENAVNFMRATNGQSFMNRNGISVEHPMGNVQFSTPSQFSGGSTSTGSIDYNPLNKNQRLLTSQYGSGSATTGKAPGWQNDPNRKTTIDGQNYTGADPMRQHLTPIVQGQQVAAQNAAVAQFDQAHRGALNSDKTAPGALPGQSPYQSLTDPNGLPGYQIPQAQQHQIADLTTLNLPKAPTPATPAPTPASAAPAASQPPASQLPPGAGGIARLGPPVDAQGRELYGSVTAPPIKAAAVQAWLNKTASLGEAMGFGGAPALGAPAYTKEQLTSPPPSAAPAAQVKSAPAPAAAPVSPPAAAPVAPPVSASQPQSPRPVAKPAPKANTAPFGYTQYGDMRAPAVKGLLPNLHQGLDEMGENISAGLLHTGNWLGSNLFGSPQVPETDWRPDFQKRWAERAQQQNQSYRQVGDPNYKQGSTLNPATLNFAAKCAAFASAVMHTPSGLAHNAGTMKPQFQIPGGNARPRVVFKNSPAAAKAITPLTAAA